jgi:hypothetical protein
LESETKKGLAALLIVFLVVVGGLTVATNGSWLKLLFAGPSSGTTGGYTPGGTGGQAYCGNAGALVSVLNPPGNCYPISETITLTPVDAITGATFASPYNCRFISPSGQIYEDPTVNSAGACVTAQPYSVGQALNVEICSAASCAWAASTPLNTNFYAPLPSQSPSCAVWPNTGCTGAGTVSFATVNTQTTLPLKMPVVVQKNGVWKITVTNSNGTSLATGLTALQGWVGFGNKPTLNICLSETASAATNPYYYGYASGNEYDYNGRLLSPLLQQEITIGTATSIGTVTGGLQQVALKSATDIVWGVTPSDASISQWKNSAGQFQQTGTFCQTVSYDLSAVQSTKTNTLNVDFYAYVNAVPGAPCSGGSPYYNCYLTPNTPEAIKGATQWTLTYTAT